MASLRAFLKRRKRFLDFIHLLSQWSSAIGIAPLTFINAARVFPIVLREYLMLKKQNASENSKWNMYFTHPRFEGKHDSSGVASG
ncbi:MAG TPA: hypothetical protein VF478_03335, partial [Anaerolineae bacterium]